MDEDIPIPAWAARLLKELHAQNQLLRDTVIFLCGTTVPREALDRYIERIQVPVEWGSAENLEIMEGQISTFLRDLEKRFPVPKD